MSSEKGEGEQTSSFPTPIQTFVLSYLYTEDLKNFELLGSTYTSFHIVTPTAITIKHLSTILPDWMTLEMPSPEDIENQLNDLIARGFLERRMKNEAGQSSYFYSITTGGTLFVKGYITRLSSAIKDRKISEQEVDRVQGDSRAKNYLKETILNKVVDKTLDQIVEGVFSGIKIVGPTLVSLIMQLGR